MHPFRSEIPALLVTGGAGLVGSRVTRPLLERGARVVVADDLSAGGRSEEHTSELQSRRNLVCRRLREKKKHT